MSFYNEPLEQEFKKDFHSRLARVQFTSVDSGEAQVLQPAIAICFDQKVDPLQVVQFIDVSASQWRFKSVGVVTLVPQDEIAALRSTILRSASWLDQKPDQCVVIRCSEAFAPNTTVTVKIEKVFIWVK